MEPTSIVCPGCGFRVTPIYIFDRSPKTKKPYLITRCPKSSCNFNIDIEDYTGKPRRRPEDNKKDNDNGENGGKSYWRYGL